MLQIFILIYNLIDSHTGAVDISVKLCEFDHGLLGIEPFVIDFKSHEHLATIC